MQLARGLRKIVEMYGDQILAATGGWVEWESPLGCGHYGCVWELWSQDPAYDEVPSLARPTGRVLKISVDPTEGPVISAIMKTGLDKTLNGLARWEGVWRIPLFTGSSAGRDKAWVIIREEIRPAKDSGDWTAVLGKYNGRIRKVIDLKTESKREKAHEEAMEEVGRLYDHPEVYYVAEAIDTLSREGIILADIHPANLGSRLHPTEEQPLIEVYLDRVKRPPLLIFDPGHSKAPPTEVPDLW